MIDEAKTQGISFAIFKPAKVIDFIVESVERDWNSKKLESLKRLSQQTSLFQTVEEIEEEFKVVQKVPYKFSRKFEDETGNQRTMMIEDWEIGMLYFNCLRRADGDECIATAKVREKYFDGFTKRDLHFFLGTTKQYHNLAPNPFIIIGTFYPPTPDRNPQMSLFDLVRNGG